MIGGTHSREWVGPATMMQVADWVSGEVTKNYETVHKSVKMYKG